MSAASCSPRRDTGTITFIGAGATRRSRASCRSAPATTVSATSLSDPPQACLTSSSFETATVWPTSVRRGPIAGLRNDEGAERATSSPTASAARRSVPPSRGGEPAARAARPSARSGSAPDSTSASTASRVGPGARSPAHASAGGAGSGAFGSRSSSSSATASADLPSTIAWWIFITRPTLPSSSRGARWISHSGCERSSGEESTASARASKSARASTSSSAESPITWRRRSNPSASTHTGAANPPGGKASRMRKRGALPSLDATCARTRASVMAGRAGSGEKRPFHATCICARAVSVWRKEASSGVRRSGTREGCGPAARQTMASRSELRRSHLARRANRRRAGRRTARVRSPANCSIRAWEKVGWGCMASMLLSGGYKHK